MDKKRISIMMRIGLAFTIFLLSDITFAQPIYGPQGQYQGYMQTSPNGVTNVYNASGQNTQSFQTDNGQTNFYSPKGAYQGTSVTPINPPPNTSIGSPRQAPQAPNLTPPNGAIYGPR